MKLEIPFDRSSRKSIYQAILKAKGRNNILDYAHNEVTEEEVNYPCENPFKPIIDWIERGDEVSMTFMFVWVFGGGQTGIKDKNYSTEDDKLILEYTEKLGDTDHIVKDYDYCSNCGKRTRHIRGECIYCHPSSQKFI